MKIYNNSVKNLADLYILEDKNTVIDVKGFNNEIKINIRPSKKGEKIKKIIIELSKELKGLLSRTNEDITILEVENR
ncbi:MAG: hypothetical protein QXY47_05385 [Thermoplasmata archaeon]